MGRRDGRGAKAGIGRSADEGASVGSALAATKVCPVCGLPFSNRKKWAARGLWPSIVYCSERCRRGGARRALPGGVP